MEKNTPMKSGGDEQNVGELVAILRKAWWRIVLVSLAAGVVTYLFDGRSRMSIVRRP
jgi:uncharacterized protein involved in exopolysaccharide biosynthesis